MKSLRLNDGYMIPALRTRTNTYGKKRNVSWMQ